MEIFWLSWVVPCWDFLNLCVDVICLQCLQIRIPAAQCSHWSIFSHRGWYTCLAVAYPLAAMLILNRNNGNQTLCFTGNHFRCYAWLDSCIQWALSLSVAQQTGTKHGTAFCVAATGKAIASEAFTMERKQCFISATSAAIVYFSLKSTLSLSGMFGKSTKMLLFWLVQKNIVGGLI